MRHNFNGVAPFTAFCPHFVSCSEQLDDGCAQNKYFKMLFCSRLNIRCGVIVIGQNSHGSSPEWRTKEKRRSCVHKGNAFPKTMKWAFTMYE